MSISANLHGAAKVEASEYGGSSWLRIEAVDGDFISVFMPFATAQAMAVAFRAAQLPAELSEAVRLLSELAAHKPEIISGRRHDPQDDVDDYMPVPEFEAFQEDARIILSKIGAA